jgi:hypothetical protein
MSYTLFRNKFPSFSMIGSELMFLPSIVGLLSILYVF